jgi:DNA-binding PadR family transcriptional regulator
MKARLSQLEIRILYILRDEPLYGHMLWHKLARDGTTSRSSVYEALRRLSSLGYLLKREVFSQVGPVRYYWSCTPSGKKVAGLAWLNHRQELARRLRELVREYRLIMGQLAIGEETVTYTVDRDEAVSQVPRQSPSDPP